MINLRADTESFERGFRSAVDALERLRKQCHAPRDQRRHLTIWKRSCVVGLKKSGNVMRGAIQKKSSGRLLRLTLAPRYLGSLCSMEMAHAQIKETPSRFFAIASGRIKDMRLLRRQSDGWMGRRRSVLVRR